MASPHAAYLDAGSMVKQSLRVPSTKGLSSVRRFAALSLLVKAYSSSRRAISAANSSCVASGCTREQRHTHASTQNSQQTLGRGPMLRIHLASRAKEQRRGTLDQVHAVEDAQPPSVHAETLGPERLRNARPPIRHTVTRHCAAGHSSHRQHGMREEVCARRGARVLGAPTSCKASPTRVTMHTLDWLKAPPSLLPGTTAAARLL